VMSASPVCTLDTGVRHPGHAMTIAEPRPCRIVHSRGSRRILSRRIGLSACLGGTGSLCQRLGTLAYGMWGLIAGVIAMRIGTANILADGRGWSARQGIGKAVARPCAEAGLCSP
jgi:hypothetical protein